MKYGLNLFDKLVENGGKICGIEGRWNEGNTSTGKALVGHGCLGIGERRVLVEGPGC